MKTKHTYITVAALIALLLLVCVRDDTDIGPGGEDTTEVSIDVLVPGSGYGPTRALTAARENHVEDITVLVFDAGGAFRYRADARSVQTTGSDNVKRFSVKLKTGQCDLWVFANCKDIIDAYTIPSNATKASLRQNLLLEMSGKWNTTYAGFVPLPMWGERTGVNVTPDLSLTGTGNRIPLIRAVAKAEVTINRATVPASDFTMEGVRFYHWSNRGQIVPDEAVLSSDKTKVTAISGNTGTTAAAGRQTYGSSERDSDGFFTNLIYVPETPAGTAGAITGNPCLIIHATHQGTDGWYKIEFLDDEDKPLPLLRNYRYTFEIVKVGGRGYATPDEAYKSKAENLTVRVHTHNDATLTNVMYDGQYWLAWDPDKFELDKEAHGTDDEHHNLMQIETNCENGWEFQRIEYPAGGQTGWLSIPSADQSGGKDVRGKVHFITTANTGGPRSAVVHFSAGRMDMSVEVIQSDENDMEILLLDADDNPLGDIFWVNTVEKKIQERLLRVKWTPAEAKMSVTVHSATDDRRDVLYEPGGDIPNGQVYVGGIHEYNLRFSELRNSDALDNFNQYEYFRDKPYRTRYTFTLDYHGKKITKDLIIAHHLELFELYTYQPSGYLMGVYYWDQSLGFGASAPFEYELSNNNPGLLTFFHGPRGGMVPGFEPWDNGYIPPGAYYDGYEWTINVKNPTVERRFQYETLTLRFPKSELPDTTIVFKTQNILPNCYMVPPGQSVHIPVRNPWDARFIGHPEIRFMPLPELPVTGDFTCERLWEDVDGLIESVVFTPAHTFDPNRTEMTVRTNGSLGEGNAVIALRRNGVIIWSWHVWVTAYDPDAPGANLYTYNADGDPLLLMDRNLGATANQNDTQENKLRSVGMYYQGGRKNPFPPLGRIPGTQTETPALGEHKRVYPENNIFNTAEYIHPIEDEERLLRTVENPTTFITASSYPYDWYGDNTFWERWTRRQNEAELVNPKYIEFKVSNDPCPKGWMVANGHTKLPYRTYLWGDMGSSGKFFPSGNTATIPGNFGLITTLGDYYPATGYINHIDGNYTEVGFNIVVAAGSFIDETNGSNEKLSFGMEFPVGRSYGYSSFPYATGRNVRCMKIDYYFPEND